MLLVREPRRYVVGTVGGVLSPVGILGRGFSNRFYETHVGDGQLLGIYFYKHLYYGSFILLKLYFFFLSNERCKKSLYTCFPTVQFVFLSYFNGIVVEISINYHNFDENVIYN